MTNSNDHDRPPSPAAPHKPLTEFHAQLTPHRSLGPTGFLLVMGLIAAVSFITGLVFLAMGAWPVLGFFGLDVAIIYAAFKLNYRSGRMVETIDLTRDNLKLTRIHPSGRHESYDFNPYWVRVRLDHEGRRERRTDDDGTSTGLLLYHHGHKTSFAAFLNDEERRDFASALRAALLDVKRHIHV